MVTIVETRPRAATSAFALATASAAEEARYSDHFVSDTSPCTFSQSAYTFGPSFGTQMPDVVPFGSVAGLAGAMDQVLDDPLTAATLGRRGRERIVSGYGLAEMIARHDSLYGELLEERSWGSAILANQ